jgi:hypothetical protein
MATKKATTTTTEATATTSKGVLKTYELPVHITFMEGVLGTLPNDKEILNSFITSKSADAVSRTDEIEAVGIEEVIDKGKTVFPRDPEGRPFIYDYQLKGFFKEKCSFLKNINGTESAKMTAFKKKIDGLFFIKDRRNPITITDGLSIESCQRPLRAETAQGPRVSLANSEEIPVGSECDFTVLVFDKSHIDIVKEWLEYGIVHGTGQWRNSGKGRFICEFGEVTEGEMTYAEHIKRAKAAIKAEIAQKILEQQEKEAEKKRQKEAAEAEKAAKNAGK